MQIFKTSAKKLDRSSAEY